MLKLRLAFSAVYAARLLHCREYATLGARAHVSIDCASARAHTQHVPRHVSLRSHQWRPRKQRGLLRCRTVDLRRL